MSHSKLINHHEIIFKHCLDFYTELSLEELRKKFREQLAYFLNEDEMSKIFELNQPLIIQIGEDITDYYLLNQLKINFSSSGRTSKQVYSYSYQQENSLTKDDYYLVLIDSEKFFPLILFEFAKDHGPAPIKIKTDFLFHLIKTNTDDAEEIFLWKDFKVVRKFTVENAKNQLDQRIKLFESQPTTTNTVLLFQIIDAVILHHAKQGILDIDEAGEKILDRFEKLKNLALGTKYHEERRLAVTRCLSQFTKLLSE